MNITLATDIEEWPIAGAFVIARGAKSSTCVVVARASCDGVTGVGECTPYARYGESAEAVCASILAQRDICRDATPAQARAALLSAMKPGAGRNALDCALWSLEARLTGTPVWRRAGLPEPRVAQSAFTISLGAPDVMARAAAAVADFPLLKLKLGGGDDPARIAAVRAAAPSARLIVDANEAWRPTDWARNVEACMRADVEMIEQPFPAADDACLAHMTRPICVCADESIHDETSLPAIIGKYDAVNVKLDKAGGLTASLQLIQAARAHGLRTMVGCMVSTSLGVAPAVLLAGLADYVDLDGPMHLTSDRAPSLVDARGRITPPTSELWG